MNDIKNLDEQTLRLLNKNFDSKKHVRFIFLGNQTKVKNGKLIGNIKVINASLSEAVEIFKNI